MCRFFYITSIKFITTVSFRVQENEIVYNNIRARIYEELRSVTVRICLLPEKKGQETLAVVFIQDVSQVESKSSNESPQTYDVGREAEQRIVDLEQELQFTRENLQATIEELETSNEELQATNEELLASNQELQARNRALEVEVLDLQNGLEAVEERARSELGMIGKDETFYMIVD